MKNNNIPIIIPSYEPDHLIIELCRNLLQHDLTNVIIVNDGSSSEYDHIFETLKNDFGFPVLKHEINRGKGRALKTAFQFVINTMPEAIGCITADSDGQHSPKDILKCMHALEETPNSLILGCRDFSGENIPPKSRFGNNLTKKICKYLCAINVSDTQTGLRGIPIAFMQRLLSVKGERFEFETRMLIESKDHYPIKEVPIETIYDSKENHKTHFHPFIDSIKIYKIFAIIFLKYIVSSISSFLLDILLFWLFSFLFKGILPSLYVAIATILARILSSTYNCLANYKFVFNSTKKLRSSMLWYFALAGIQMFISAGLVTIGVFLFPSISEVVIKIIIDTFLFFINYFIQKRYIF